MLLSHSVKGYITFILENMNDQNKRVIEVINRFSINDLLPLVCYSLFLFSCTFLSFPSSLLNFFLIYRFGLFLLI